MTESESGPESPTTNSSSAIERTTRLLRFVKVTATTLAALVTTAVALGWL
jgi:hypothetical protein